jgi:hypothetical protein
MQKPVAKPLPQTTRPVCSPSTDPSVRDILARIAFYIGFPLAFWILVILLFACLIFKSNPPHP